MPVATKKRPAAKTQPNLTSNPPISAPPIRAFAIVKSPNSHNLWYMATYTIQNDQIVKVDKSVDDLREILVAKTLDLVGGLL